MFNTHKLCIWLKIYNALHIINMQPTVATSFYKQAQCWLLLHVVRHKQKYFHLHLIYTKCDQLETDGDAANWPQEDAVWQSPVRIILLLTTISTTPLRRQSLLAVNCPWDVCNRNIFLLSFQVCPPFSHCSLCWQWHALWALNENAFSHHLNKIISQDTSGIVWVWFSLIWSHSACWVILTFSFNACINLIIQCL